MSGLLLESANGEAAHLYTYDSFGRVTEEIANGIRKVYTYDSGDRVTSLKVYQGSVLEMDLAYEYDAAGLDRNIGFFSSIIKTGQALPVRFLLLSALIFEFPIVQGHDVAVLNAHPFQLLVETGLPQSLVEVHAALVVGEVDVAHEALQPGTLDDPGALVVPLDVQRRGGIHHGGLGHILRLVHGDGRQGG